MDFKEIAMFRGTIGRQQWWISTIVLALLITVIEEIIFATASSYEAIYLTVVFSNVVFYWACFTLGKARANDAGWNGWWQFMPFFNIALLGFFPTEEKK